MDQHEERVGVDGVEILSWVDLSIYNRCHTDTHLGSSSRKLLSTESGTPTPWSPLTYLGSYTPLAAVADLCCEMILNEQNKLERYCSVDLPCDDAEQDDRLSE